MASQVQLCTLFLQETAEHAYKTFEDIGTTGTLALSSAWTTGQASPSMSPMDMVLLLDGIILHELTHATTYPFPTEDIGTHAYGNRIAISLISD